MRSSTVLSDSPGICISIVVPDRAMSGSPTPKASTRLRMFSSAVFIVSGVGALGRGQDHRDAALEVQTEHRAQAAGGERGDRQAT